MSENGKKSNAPLVKYAVDYLAQGVLILDEQHRILSLSGQVQMLLGVKEEEATGKELGQYLKSDQALKEVTDRIKKNQHDPVKSKANVELHALDKQGKTIPVECTLSLFKIKDRAFILASVEKKQVNANPISAQSPRLLDGGDSDESGVDQSGTEWLLSYVDVMTLLVVFFVLIYSLTAGSLKSDADNAKSAIARQMTLSSSLDFTANLFRLPSLREDAPLAPINIIPPIDRLTQQHQLFLTQLENTIDAQDIDIIKDDNALKIRMTDDVLFSLGETDLAPQGESIIYELAKLLRETQYDITIAGHTDSAPISRGNIASNWELSSLRASAVVRYLIDAGIDPTRLKSVGYADTQPLITSTSDIVPENRRVELLLHIPKD